MLLNSDVRGNVKPSEAQQAIYDVCNEIVEEYFYEVNRITNRSNRGLINGGLENLPERIREKILHFLVEDVALIFENSYFLLPKDLRYIDAVIYGDATIVEFCKSKREFNIISNYADTIPTETYPVALRIGEKIKIAPSVIVDDVTISYLRNPLFPKWTFQMINGVELFNPDAPDFQDIDLHPSEEHKVVMLTLNRFGINLKEQDIAAMTINHESQEFNQQNAS